MKINTITEQHLQEIIFDAHKKGRSKKTLTNIRGCISAFIKYCRKCGATSLVVENVKIPKGAPVGERTILQPNDIKLLFERNDTILKGKIVNESYVYAFRFAVLTGLRPGELIGLKWGDIDFDNKIISINRSINAQNQVTDGKTKNAIRRIAINPLIMNVLKERKLEAGKLIDIDNFVFTNEDGDYIKTKNLYERWKKYIKHVDIESNTTLYELRHTFISLVKILPVGLVKPIVGHSVNMDTYGTYGHEVDGQLEETGNLIHMEFNKIFDQK